MSPHPNPSSVSSSNMISGTMQNGHLLYVDHHIGFSKIAKAAVKK
jgi:hypothetical protein